MKLTNIYGLFTLASLIILLILYIIKPVYNKKNVSSTYLWKQSMQYHKKDISISRLRNIFIILCQVLILTMSTLVITMPIVYAASSDVGESIIILDSSASMQAEQGGVTRYSRAISQIAARAEKTINDGSIITLIVASAEPTILIEKNNSYIDVSSKLKGLDEASTKQPALGVSDIEESMKLAYDLNAENSHSTVTLYTSSEYANSGDVQVVNMSLEDEWNVGILDFNSALYENYYQFQANIAMYNNTKAVAATLKVENINGTDTDYDDSKNLNLESGEQEVILFKNTGVYSYRKATLTITMADGSNDSYSYDNIIELHNGELEKIDILYMSPRPNVFMSTVLHIIKDTYKGVFDINITQPLDGEGIAGQSFDLYIYEHSVPTKIADDGAVLLINPDRIPDGLGVKLGISKYGNFEFSNNGNHPILNQINASNMQAAEYRPIESDDSYDKLIYTGDNDVFVVKSTPTLKLGVLSFDLNKSNLPLLLDFPIMMSNTFDYFFPQLITDNIFEVGGSVSVNARGSDVKITNSDGSIIYSSESNFQHIFSGVGSHSVSQVLINGKVQKMQFFIRVAESESNISKTSDSIPGAFKLKDRESTATDILLYISIALYVAVLIERLLYASEKI